MRTLQSPCYPRRQPESNSFLPGWRGLCLSRTKATSKPHGQRSPWPRPPRRRVKRWRSRPRPGSWKAYSAKLRWHGHSSSAYPLDVAAATDHGEQALLARILLFVQTGELARAAADASSFRYGEPRTSVAFEARRHLANGLVLALRGDASASEPIGFGTALARRQGAALWVRYGLTLGALADRSQDPSSAVAQSFRESPVVLSMLAEPVLDRLNDLTPEAVEFVITEAKRRPWRWRVATRRQLEAVGPGEHFRTATLLEAIGEREDVQRLRDADKGSRDRRASKLGLELARRLADRVFIDDLGRVRILSGSRVVEGGEVRRKVLALLCLLVSRSRFHLNARGGR